MTISPKKMALVTSFVAGGLISACDDPPNEDEHPLAAEIKVCEEVCAKQLCDYVTTPASNFAQLCLDDCTQAVEQADEEDCLELYLELYSCLNDAPCEDFLDWRRDGLSTICQSQEEAVTAACPEVELRV